MQKPTETVNATRSRQSALIEMNIRWLGQALTLLTKFDDAVYSTSPPGFAPHRVGAHLRHILEFYQSFMNGVESRRIDYDARRRDKAVERSSVAASTAIRNIIHFFETSALLRQESAIWVRMEDADHSEVEDSFMQSSISRELQALSSHTIHHFALMAMILRMHRIELDPEFGMAPSTLSYLASRAAVPAEAA
jgi:hypothetical protein